MAVDSVGCEVGPTVAFEVQVMVEGLKQIRERIRDIEEKIYEICSQFPEYEFLLSIPGFGPDISAKVLGAVGDPFRFQSGKQVLKMAGLDLSAERSGKTSQSAIPKKEKRIFVMPCIRRLSLLRPRIRTLSFITLISSEAEKESLGSRPRCG
jgi:transposase